MEKELIIMEAQELGVNRKNWEVYNAYLTSKAIQSKETVQTTYKTYFNNVKLFFQYLKVYEEIIIKLLETREQQYQHSLTGVKREILLK